MRPIFIRLIAGILLIYGLAGLAVSLWGANQATQLFGDARATLDTTYSVDSESMARTIARTLGSAASASSAGSESLSRAQESIRAGSASAAELSNAMSALGNDLSFELFGTRPFADVVGPVRRSSQNLSTLASSLTTTEQSLDANRQSFDELERELRDLESQSNQVADRIAAATESRALSRTISSAEWLANLVIGGFALQSVLFLAIGCALLLVAPPRVTAIVPPLDGE
ncbi:MAG TPA: hypothetical protein VHX16_13600 [Chloroflexota bacterium]|nr:hypothetical protein [Chloroflexota bacterium]